MRTGSGFVLLCGMHGFTNRIAVTMLHGKIIIFYVCNVFMQGKGHHHHLSSSVPQEKKTHRNFSGGGAFHSWNFVNEVTLVDGGSGERMGIWGWEGTEMPSWLIVLVKPCPFSGNPLEYRLMFLGNRWETPSVVGKERGPGPIEEGANTQVCILNTGVRSIRLRWVCFAHSQTLCIVSKISLLLKAHAVSFLIGFWLILKSGSLLSIWCFVDFWKV